MFLKNLVRTAVALAAFSVAAAASAATVTLTFEGLLDSEGVGNFYNGGAGTLGTVGTDNYGVTFSGNTLALRDSDVGGSGNFGNEPSPDTVMFFDRGASTTLNYAAGFTTGFSFWYTSIDTDAIVEVFDGLNGSGNRLGEIVLSGLGGCPAGSPDPGAYCQWAIGSVGLAGIAQSIVFSGAANFIGFDNITFGATQPGTGNPPTNPVPEPGSLALVGLALLALRTARRG